MSEPKSQEKPFSISKHLVWEAYGRVKANKGAPGVDGCSIEAESVNLVEALRCGIYCAASCGSVGGLIQAMPGSSGGWGGFRTNRSG